MCKVWSRNFILTSACTPWYTGEEIKFGAAAGSEQELVDAVHRKAHELTRHPRDQKLRIKFNTTPRSDLIRGQPPKWLDLDVETLQQGQLPGQTTMLHARICSCECVGA